MRSTSAFKRTEIPECIYILTERDKIIVHWLLCMIFFALSNHWRPLHCISVQWTPLFLRVSIWLGWLKCIQKLPIRSVITACKRNILFHLYYFRIVVPLHDYFSQVFNDCYQQKHVLIAVKSTCHKFSRHPNFPKTFNYSVNKHCYEY